MRDYFRRICSLSPGLLVLAVFVLAGNVPVVADQEDFQYWAKAIFMIPIAERWDFGLEHKFGFQDEARHLDHHMQDFLIVHTNAAGWLKLGGAVKVSHAPTDDRQGWTGEVRPHFNIAISSQFRGIDIVNRSRLAYRHIEDDDSYWRFRHKIRVDSPMTFTPLQIKPYVAEEIFYRFSADRYNGNRVQTGLFIPLKKNMRLDLFYFWHFSKEDDHHWSQADVIGSYLQVKF